MHKETSFFQTFLAFSLLIIIFIFLFSLITFDSSTYFQAVIFHIKSSSDLLTNAICMKLFKYFDQ